MLMYTTTDSCNQFTKYFSVYISLVIQHTMLVLYILAKTSLVPATFSNIIHLNI